MLRYEDGAIMLVMLDLLLAKLIITYDVHVAANS